MNITFVFDGLQFGGIERVGVEYIKLLSDRNYAITVVNLRPCLNAIHAKKRLYMTATPRIYADASKQKAKDNSALLCSMDDESIYGPEFYRLSFSDAVSQGLLSDYKVVVLAVDEEFVSRSLQKQLTDSNNELTLDDAVKIVGCMNGLAKKTHFPGEENYFSNDPQPMRRAVAFTQTIEQSKKFVAMFEEIQALYPVQERR